MGLVRPARCCWSQCRHRQTQVIGSVDRQTPSDDSTGTLYDGLQMVYMIYKLWFQVSKQKIWWFSKFSFFWLYGKVIILVSCFFVTPHNHWHNTCLTTYYLWHFRYHPLGESLTAARSVEPSTNSDEVREFKRWASANLWGICCICLSLLPIIYT